MNAQQVKAALAREPERNGDGRYRCQVCGKEFSKAGLGPHQLGHRREVGLAPPRATNGTNARTHSYTCDEPGCGSTVMGSSLPQHFRKVHGLNLDDSLNRSYNVRMRATASRALVAVEPESEPEPETVWNGVSALDAATGILNAARKDGLIPVRILPEVHEWIAATEHLLGRLEKLSR